MRKFGAVAVIILIVKIVIVVWAIHFAFDILSNPAGIGAWFRELVNGFNPAQ